MKWLTLITGFLSVMIMSSFAHASTQESLIIGAAQNRILMPLNGQWQVIIDPLSAGDTNPVEGRRPIGFNNNRVARNANELIEYKFDNARTLEVPGDWNTQDPSLMYYQGPIWYKRDVQLSKVEGKRYFLNFGAASYKADVYVNTKLVGTHEGAYTSFNLEVTKYLKDGQNTVIVKVDNTLGQETVPTNYNDWWNYGGLTREVYLLETPEVFIANTNLHLVDHKRGLVKGWVQLNGSNIGNQDVKLRIPELDFETSVQTGENGIAEISFSSDFDLWSPSNPRLYKIMWETSSDKTSDKVGFRTINANGGELLLNGNPIFLKGISIHSESISGKGRIRHEDDAREILNAARELGVNFVRLAHYPHNEHMLRLADEMGLLVWSEIPVYWAIDWENAESLDRAKRQLSEMIKRDQNRASIIIWSIANETPVKESRFAFLNELVKSARAEDSSRLISAASEPSDFIQHYASLVMSVALKDELLSDDKKTELRKWMKGSSISKDWPLTEQGDFPENYRPSIVINDDLGELVDIIAFNEYLGWYFAAWMNFILPLDEPDIRRLVLKGLNTVEIKSKYEKPIIISEFGAGAKLGMRGDKHAIWTEDMQAYLYERQVEMIRNNPHVTGISPWVLKDFRSPLRPLNGVQDGWNRKGLISEDGAKKEAFFVLKKFYSEYP